MTLARTTAGINKVEDAGRMPQSGLLSVAAGVFATVGQSSVLPVHLLGLAPLLGSVGPVGWGRQTPG